MCFGGSASFLPHNLCFVSEVGCLYFSREKAEARDISLGLPV